MKICSHGGVRSTHESRILPSITHLHRALSRYAETKLEEGDQYLIERLPSAKRKEPSRMIFTLNRRGTIIYLTLYIDFRVRCSGNIICGPTAAAVVAKMAQMIKECFDGKS